MITVNDRKDFLQALYEYMPHSSYVVELGVFKGDFSELISNILHPEYLILVDPFQTNSKIYNKGLGFLPSAYSTNQDYENLCKRFAWGIKISHILVDRSYSFDAVLNYENRSFDLIYHDASHLYEDIKRDLNEWLPKLKSGGLMCGHDYIQHESFGVIQAVDEFIKEHNFEMIIFNTNGGDYALRAIQ